MFSETGLGSFLRSIYAGSRPEFMRKESALALASLLLADESMTRNLAIRDELRQVLAAIYGDNATWRSHESPVSASISDELSQILKGIDSGCLKAKAYIAGLIGLSDSTEFYQDRRCQRIHSKVLRIFWGKVSDLPPRGANTFVVIVGLKGSGKTSVLRILEEQGDEVLELYRELDHLKNDAPDKVAVLPSREDWEDEPLQLTLNQRGVTAGTRRSIFLGSLLRMSEVELLSGYGKVTFIHLDATNALRHERARGRGRAIEKVADEAKLIELDAHRDGLWPAYEQNDLGGLVDLCGYAIKNDRDDSPEDIVKSVRGILDKEVEDGSA